MATAVEPDGGGRDDLAGRRQAVELLDDLDPVLLVEPQRPREALRGDEDRRLAVALEVGDRDGPPRDALHEPLAIIRPARDVNEFPIGRLLEDAHFLVRREEQDIRQAVLVRVGDEQAVGIGARVLDRDAHFLDEGRARPDGQHVNGLVAVLRGDVEDFALAVGEEVGDAHASRLADDRQRPREGQAALRVEAHQAQHRFIGAEDEHRRGAVHLEHGDVRHALQAWEGGLPVPLAGAVLAEELDLGRVGVGDDDVHPFRIGQRAEGERVRAPRAVPAQRVALERPVEEHAGIRRLGADLINHQPALRPLDRDQFGGAVPVQVAEGHAAHGRRLAAHFRAQPPVGVLEAEAERRRLVAAEVEQVLSAVAVEIGDGDADGAFGQARFLDRRFELAGGVLVEEVGPVRAEEDEVVSAAPAQVADRQRVHLRRAVGDVERPGGPHCPFSSCETTTSSRGSP